MRYPLSSMLARGWRAMGVSLLYPLFPPVAEFPSSVEPIHIYSCFSPDLALARCAMGRLTGGPTSDMVKPSYLIPRLTGPWNMPIIAYEN